MSIPKNKTCNMILEEKKISGERGDHFAGSDANDCIWNSSSKNYIHDSESFLRYYSNPWLPLICSAWLGLQHRLTTQVNVVKSGAKAQISHRDYHNWFQGKKACAKFPKAMQIANQILTLQGAVAHSDMPVESGPTWLLPFSQNFEERYLVYRIPEFQEYFPQNYVPLPLEKGDRLFFNPALFHAAGQNRSDDVLRSANLLQISAALGEPMGTTNSMPLIEATWNGLVEIAQT